MDRRIFLKSSIAWPLAASLPRVVFAQQSEFNPQPSGWRTFQIITRVDVLKPAGVTRLWVPVPVIDDESQRPLGTSWTGNASTMRVTHDGKYGAAIFYAEWPEGVSAPVVEVTANSMTQDRVVDLSKPNPTVRLDPADVAFYTATTDLQPTDGIVRKTALEVTKGAKTEMAKAKALYEWVVDNTARDPKTRGCGVGDIKAMLETGNLSGKCADLNALYVGLARSVGLPARDLYGIRVARSQFGYRSLGAGSENITRAQHCRAEVFLTGYGWVPADPADVRKVVLEEKAQPTTLADPLVPPVRRKLFGSWEMNWVGFNHAHDVRLPNSKGDKVAFFMYPQLETANGRADSLDPDHFKYTITAREIKA
jgi:transglutaminase-like putative cysteine protease